MNLDRLPAEALVECASRRVGIADDQVAGRRTAGSDRAEERLDQRSAVTRAPVAGEQVDVQVSGMRREFWPQHVLGMKHRDLPRVLRGHRDGGRRPVPSAQPWHPVFPVVRHELVGVRGTDDVADGALAVVQHVGMPRRQRQVGADENVGHEIVGAVPPASALSGLGSLKADVIDRVPVAVAVSADRGPSGVGPGSVPGIAAPFLSESLVQIETATGHGQGKPKRMLVAESADMLAFAAESTGLTPG